MRGRRGRISLRELKEEAYAASVGARQLIAQASSSLTVADKTLLEMKAMLAKAILTWTEVAEELLDGSRLGVGVKKNALIELMRMVKTGDEGTLPFELLWLLREEGDAPEPRTDQPQPPFDP